MSTPLRLLQIDQIAIALSLTGEQIMKDFPGNVGQAKITTVEAIGQLGVVDAHLV